MVYYGFLIIVLFMGQYIKEQLRKKKAVSEEMELSEERAEAGCWKLYAIRITAGIFLAVGILILGFHPAGSLKVICLDVGQGDGYSCGDPGGSPFLIDGGSSSQSELGRYCLLPALKSQGISWLDGIVISHTDQDHINGVKELLEYMGKGLTTIRAGYLILPAWAERPDAWRSLQRQQKQPELRS